MFPGSIARAQSDRIALIVTPDGQVQPLADPDDTIIPRVLGHATNTTIGLTATVDLWHDPYAVLVQRPDINPLAIAIATSMTGIPITICGPALIAAHTDSGQTVGLSPDELAELVSWYSDIASICRRHRQVVAA